jgi:hypothetical protein
MLSKISGQARKLTILYISEAFGFPKNDLIAARLKLDDS